MAEIQEFNEKQSIVESTRLIRNMFDSTFTKRQMDLIYAVMSLVKPNDDKFTEYYISYNAIGKIFNPANPDCTITIKDIEKAVKGIINKSFRMEDDEEIIYYHYVETARINKKDKCLKFKINNEVQQFYLKLKKGKYTSFLLEDILALSTTFQMNLFRWLACNSGFENDVEISIENAKTTFYGKQIETKELIRRVDTALEKINAKTNIRATYEKVKTGKTITSLKFSIDNKYVKPIKPKTDAQIIADNERNKAMWERNLELQKKVDELESKIAIMKIKEMQEKKKMSD